MEAVVEYFLECYELGLAIAIAIAREPCLTNLIQSNWLKIDIDLTYR